MMNKSSEKSPFSVAVLLVWPTVKSSTDLSPGAGGTGWAEQSGAGLLIQQLLTEPGQQAWPPLLILNITFLPTLIKLFTSFP